MFPPMVPSVDASQVPPDAPVLDVREQDEWDAGHIAGAVHVPLSDLPSRLEDVPDDDRLVVVCRSGGRSAHAVAWLARNGYESRNLDGGLDGWLSAGRPLVSESGSAPTLL